MSTKKVFYKVCSSHQGEWDARISLLQFGSKLDTIWQVHRAFFIIATDEQLSIFEPLSYNNNIFIYMAFQYYSQFSIYIFLEGQTLPSLNAVQSKAMKFHCLLTKMICTQMLYHELLSFSPWLQVLLLIKTIVICPFL